MNVKPIKTIEFTDDGQVSRYLLELTEQELDELSGLTAYAQAYAQDRGDTNIQDQAWLWYAQLAGLASDLRPKPTPARQPAMALHLDSGTHAGFRPLPIPAISRTEMDCS